MRPVKLAELANKGLTRTERGKQGDEAFRKRKENDRPAFKQPFQRW